MTDHRQVIIDQANGLLAGEVTDTGMLLDALTALTDELAAKDRAWRQDLDSGQRPLPDHMNQGRQG